MTGEGERETRDPFGEVVAEPLSRIRQFAARRLHDAWTRIPHVTHHEDADVTRIEDIRREASRRTLTLLAYVAKACIFALERHPRLCAALDADGRTLWLKRYVNLGIAVDTPDGLVVPVVHGADRLTTAELAAAVATLAERARRGGLRPTDVEGSSFTISSLGSIGGTGFTPLINPPNVAILGIARTRLRPCWIDGGVAPRSIVPLSLSYDHRAIDGAEAARFCATVADHLAAVDTWPEG